MIYFGAKKDQELKKKIRHVGPTFNKIKKIKT